MTKEIEEFTLNDFKNFMSQKTMFERRVDFDISKTFL